MHIRYTALPLIALVLTACNPYFDTKKPFADTTTKADAIAAAPKQLAPTNSVRMTNRPMLGITEPLEKSRFNLPPAIGSKGFIWRADAPMTLPQIGQRIADQTGLPVQLDPRLSGRNTTTPTAALGSTIAAGFMQPNYQGTVEGFLHQVASTFDVDVAYQDGALVFEKFKTEILRVNVPNNTTKTEARIGATSSGTGSGAVSASSVNTSTRQQQVDHWKDIDTTVKKIVGTSGDYSTNPATRQLIIFGPPSIRREVRQYIQELNYSMRHRIAIDVSAIFIDVTDNDTFGLSVDALYRSSLNGYKLGLSGLVPTLRNQGGTASIGVLDNAVNGTFNHFANTELFLRAVADSRRLADIRNASVITSNHSPTPLNLTTDEDIISRNEFSQGTQSLLATAQTKVINYGLSIIVDPVVHDDENIQLFITVNISDLTGREDKPIGNNQILQLTKIDRRDFNTDVLIKPGETAVLAGFESNQVSNQDVGAGNPLFKLFGGSRTSAIRKTRLLLLATANLVTDTPTRYRTTQ